MIDRTSGPSHQVPRTNLALTMQRPVLLQLYFSNEVWIISRPKQSRYPDRQSQVVQGRQRDIPRTQPSKLSSVTSADSVPVSAILNVPFYFAQVPSRGP